MDFDFKPALIYIGSILVHDINQFLTTGGLILNIVYIGMQVYKHNKNNE